MPSENSFDDLVIDNVDASKILLMATGKDVQESTKYTNWFFTKKIRKASCQTNQEKNMLLQFIEDVKTEKLIMHDGKMYQLAD